MKRNYSAALCALFLALTLPSSLRADDVSVDPRFIGVWFCENDSSVYTFNADGSASVESEDYTDTDASFAAIDGVFILSMASESGNWSSYSYAFSSDGAALLLKLDAEGSWLHKNSPGSGIDVRLSGSWLNESDNSTVSFAADGKGRVTKEDGSETEFIYRAAGGIFVMNRDDGEDIWSGAFYALSSDGAALILDIDGEGAMLRKIP